MDLDDFFRGYGFILMPQNIGYSYVGHTNILVFILQNNYEIQTHDERIFCQEDWLRDYIRRKFDQA